MQPISTAKELRGQIRSGHWRKTTAGQAPFFEQANVAIMPKECAFDFLLFCKRNPKPCPLIEVMEAGNPEAIETSPGSDIRCEVPAYRVFRNGEFVEERETITDLWQDDLVTFLIGCSFTFDHALQAAGLPVRHVQTQRNVSMYRTNIACRKAGVFEGPMVVSMRPMKPDQAIRAIEISGRFTKSHGTPIHLGDPALIGIQDLAKPDYGDAVDILPDEIPVFWACGVTPQAVAIASKIPLMITHSPGKMFVTDRQDS
jgi:uncharacterized protein YcsI (UPF0317 family)